MGVYDYHPDAPFEDLPEDSPEDSVEDYADARVPLASRVAVHGARPGNGIIRCFRRENRPAAAGVASSLSFRVLVAGRGATGR
jgi:hypothetical protein